MVGVIAVPNSNSNISTANYVIEKFEYDGVDNVFVLADAAKKVLHVLIDNGTYPKAVPEGEVEQVEIPADLLLAGNLVTIHYIKKTGR